MHASGESPISRSIGQDRTWKVYIERIKHDSCGDGLGLHVASDSRIACKKSPIEISLFADILMTDMQWT